MKKIGMIGGVSWLSTMEYYRAICELSHRHQSTHKPPGPPVIPEMAIESLNVNKSYGIRGIAGDDASWAEFDAYFNSALKRLEASGAEIAFIASNTPHNRFESIVKGISIPVISIFEVVAKYCADLGLEKALVLGTAPTMESSAFADVLIRHGVKGFVPASDADKSAIVDVIGEMQSGDMRGKADVIHRVVSHAADRFSGNPVVACLSCTELPLAFPDHLDEPSFEVNGVLYMNTTLIHANSIFASASGISI